MMLSMKWFCRRVSGVMTVLVLACCVFFALLAQAFAGDAPVPAAPFVPAVVTPYAGQAFKLVEEKAQDGDGAAELELGLRYVLGYDGVKDIPAGVAWIQKAADRGIPQAEHELGSLYLMGVGVPQSDVLSAQWYRRAAIQGYAPSQTALGYAYEEGAGVRKDPELARYWFEKAAAQHNAIAVESMGGGM